MINICQNLKKFLGNNAVISLVKIPHESDMMPPLRASSRHGHFCTYVYIAKIYLKSAFNISSSSYGNRWKVISLQFENLHLDSLVNHIECDVCIMIIS